MSRPKSNRPNPNPSGLCMCGCGEPTPIAKRTYGAAGWVKGFPTLYIRGHNGAKSPVHYVVEDRGFKTPCWVWQRSLNGHGYGQGQFNGKLMRAHVAYFLACGGHIPEGMMLDHLCRVRNCVNPDHLEPVTVAVNNRRGLSTRLTQEDVDRIRSLEGTMTKAAIAKMFGVSGPHVCNILRGKVWPSS